MKFFQWLLGNEHEGVRVIAETIRGIRLDGAISSAALMRQALIQVTIVLYRNFKQSDDCLKKKIFCVDILLGYLARSSSQSFWSIVNQTTHNETSLSRFNA